MTYFSKFPVVTYKGVSALDITRRVAITSKLNGTFYNYVPYTIKEDETPEQVAYYYYNDPSYAWLVLFANNIIDPYTQWVMSQKKFEDYLIKKYEAQSGVSGREVLDWAKNETIDDNILYYAHRDNGQIRLNVETYNRNPNTIYEAIRVYNYESDLNELRRNIILFDRRFLLEIDKEVNDELSL